MIHRQNRKASRRKRFHSFAQADRQANFHLGNPSKRSRAHSKKEDEFDPLLPLALFGSYSIIKGADSVCLLAIRVSFLHYRVGDMLCYA